MTANLPPLRHFMRLEQLDQYENDFVDYGGAWEYVCDVWAHVKTTRADQRVQNKLAELVITHTITTRWDHRIPLDNVKLRMRDLTNADAIGNGKVYNVRTWVDVDEMHERVEWECVEVRE